MSDLRTASQQALEAIDRALPHAPHCGEFDALADMADALRAALAEPVECPHGVTDGNCKECYEQSTTPRKPLTEEALSKIIDAEIGFNSCCGWEAAFARAIERAHEIK